MLANIKKRKKFFITAYVWIFIIVIMNVMGVSYSAWNDGLGVVANFSSGSIEPYLEIDNQKVVGTENNMDNGTYKFFTVTSADDGNTIEINGVCYPNFNSNIFLKIKNKGTIPVKLIEIEKEKKDKIVKSFKQLGADYNNESVDEEKIKVIQADNNVSIKDVDTLKMQIKAKEKVTSKDDGKKDKGEKDNEDEEQESMLGEHEFCYKLKFEQVTDFNTGK